MALFPVNARILRVERPAAMDRYGAPKYEVVAAEFGACLQLRRRHERTGAADFVQTDGTLHVGPAADLKAGDRVTVDNADEDRYTVFACDPVYDGAGGVLAQIATLTKIKEK